MRIAMLCLALFVSCVAVGAAQQGDPAKKALDAMQGTWRGVSMTDMGMAAPADDVAKWTVTFKGDQLTTSKRAEREVKVKLDPSKKPATIDIVEGGETSLGIYELDGDTLKICVAGRGDRPKTFESPKDSTIAYMVLKREKK